MQLTNVRLFVRLSCVGCDFACDRRLTVVDQPSISVPPAGFEPATDGLEIRLAKSKRTVASSLGIEFYADRL
jgi:hypothetical protein